VEAARRTASQAGTRAAVLRVPRAAVRTVLPSRSRPGACGPSPPRRSEPFGSFRGVEGFYFAGGALAVWALVVSALGVMREDFPSTRAATRLVGAISVVLVLGAVGSAIYLSATHEHEPKGGHAAAE
jgi:hypothetical protein